jgi:hypothetical protein
MTPTYDLGSPLSSAGMRHVMMSHINTKPQSGLSLDVGEAPQASM